MILSRTNGENNTTYFIWHAGQIISEVNQNGTVIDNYFYGLERIKSDRFGYYIHDAHGDVIALVNDVGSVTKTYTYDANGNENSPISSDLNPFRYRGEYFDKDVSLYYLRARWMDPFIGEFLTEDPIRDGHNHYIYANNNPIKYIDPSGLAAEYSSSMDALRGYRNGEITREELGIYSLHFNSMDSAGMDSYNYLNSVFSVDIYSIASNYASASLSDEEKKKIIQKVQRAVRLAITLNKFSDGDTWDNNRNVNGSTQCDAFARYVYNNLFGEYPAFLSNLPNYFENKENPIQLDEDNLYGYLKEWGQYAYVRGVTAGRGIHHSVIIKSFNESSVTVYHANYINGKVSYEENISYSDFLKIINKYITHQSAPN